MTPTFYDSSKCGTLFMPDLPRSAEAGTQFAKDNNIKSTAKSMNEPKVVLTIIDNQIDFTNPKGSLFVNGAVEDLDRVCRFIHSNIGQISHILASLDTHYLYQPFHPYNWVAGSHNNLLRCLPGPNQGRFYKEGDHPEPLTIITLQQVRDNVWLPVRLPNRMQTMLEKLEAVGKKNLCIWPIHCILGTPGHALDPVLMETIYFHAAARQDQYNLTEKGMSQSAEHYGIIQAEVQFSDDPQTQINTKIINEWQTADRIYIAGQAASHCVLESLNQLVSFFRQKNPDVLERVYVLEDCTSPVPDIKDGSGNTIVPFAQMTKDRFAQLANEGVKFVKSTAPIKI